MRKKLAAALLGTYVLAGCSSAHAIRHGAGVRYDEIPEGAYAIVADVHAKPGREEELRQVTLALVARVRREPNNVLYFLHEDREVPGHFVFYEIFVSEADFASHNETSHVRDWFATLPELADGDVRVVRMRILGNQTPSPR